MIPSAQSPIARTIQRSLIRPERAIPSGPMGISHIAKANAGRLPLFAEAFGVAVIVRTELAVLPPGTIAPGVNEQPRLLESPEHVSASALPKLPDCGDTLTVNFPEVPELIVRAVGEAPNASPEPEFAVALQPNHIFTPEDIWLAMLGLPIALT